MIHVADVAASSIGCAEGVTIIREPQEGHNAALTAALVWGPDGNPVELISKN